MWMMNQKMKEDFLKIIQEELIPAMGCTEPIALAYAAAVVLGAFGGEAPKCMEVLENVTQMDIQKTKNFIMKRNCIVEYLDSDIPLHFQIELVTEQNSVLVEVKNAHTNIVSMSFR